MTLEPGSTVKLLAEGNVLAIGRVLDTSPDAYCHAVRLGDQKLSVTVISCILNAAIPFPFEDVETLEDAINCPILWKRCNLALCENQSGAPGNSSEDIPSPRAAVTCTSDFHGAVDLSDRKTWLMKDCSLMHPSIEGMELAEARVMCIGPFQCVEGTPLGDSRVGVLLLDIFCCDDEDFMHKFFPTYRLAVPIVVAWDIAHIRFANIGVPVSQLRCEDPNILDFNVGKDKDVAAQAKRAYNFSKRKAVSPDDKESKLLAMKRSKVMREDEIFRDWRKECCKDLCCRSVVFDNIKRERDEYWSQPPGERCSTILEKMHSREESLKHAGKLIFDSKAVCKTAFYTLYGFGRTLFFEYQKKAVDGMRSGFNWGKDRKKPTQNVFQAITYMRDVIQSSSEPQPHLDYKGTNGTDRRIHKIPICLGKDGVFTEVNRLLELGGYRPISISTFYAAWRKHFDNVQIYTSCAFSKCHECLILKERLMKEKKEDVRKVIAEERQFHLGEAMSRRNLYYGHRTLASLKPDKYLSIIHDKMDQAKTGIPKLLETSKKLSQGCSPLPFSLTGMLTHGRDPGAFGHFSLNGLWPSDPNFTITSLAKCLRDLECWNGDFSGDLSITSTDGITEPFFKALLDPTPFKTGYLDPKGISPKHFCEGRNVPQQEQLAPGTFRPLPENLLLQLDNSPKDNKNTYLLAWVSQLVARGVFKTVQVSFLLVGHTHEDVDAMFSKVSSELRTQEVESLHGIMAAFWNCQNSHPVPSFIQEVADYKSFCDKSLKVMKGQSFPMSFLFFMRGNVPVMQYRENVSGSWYPLTGQTIWKVDPLTKKPLLPSGEPFAKPMRNQLRKRTEVMSFIEKYLSWKNLTTPGEGSPLSGHYQHLKRYWESIFEFLDHFETKSDPPPGQQREDDSHSGHDQLLGGFWPRTNHGTGCQEETLLPEVRLDRLEAEHADYLREMDEIFVGDLRERLPETFTPLAHIQAGEMCIIRPNDEFESICPKSLWLARALSDVDTDKASPYYLHFRIEWWRPCFNSRQKEVPDSVRYKNWSSPSRDWERDPGYAVLDETSDADSFEYMHAGSTIYSWSPGGRWPRKNVRISRTAISVIDVHFERLSEEEEQTSPEE